MAEKSRVNLYMPTDLKDYLVEEGERLGLNLTTMILIACIDYRKTQESLKLGQMFGNLTSDEQLKAIINKCKEESR